MKNLKSVKNFLHDAKAVSPAIATLILIVVAAVAAAGIGILVSHSQGSSKEMLDTKTASVQGKIVIDGSTTVLPVTMAAAPLFMADNPSYSVTTSGGGSQQGQLDVYTKKVDIGASSSKWDTASFTLNGIVVPGRGTAIIQEAGPQATIWETPIGTGLIVVAGHVTGATSINVFNGTAGSSNLTGTVLGISDTDLRAAYQTGNQITTTGTVVNISVIQRDDPSGTEETFAKWIGLTDANNQLSSPATVKGYQGNQGVRDAIANNANTVGFVDIGFAKGGVNGNDNVIPATMNSVVASKDTKGVNGPYDTASKIGPTGKGLARDLFYYSYGVPTGAVKAYLDYILSSTGQDAVHAAGFFSI